MPENKVKILDALAEYQTVMFGSENELGLIEFRPMAIATRIDDVFYFISSAKSGKVMSVNQTHKITVTAQSSNSFIYAIGDGETEENEILLKKLWNPAFQAWFPSGPEDGAVILIKFTPKQGELWDTDFMVKAKYIWELITSNIKGKKADLEDDHSTF